MFAYLYRDCTTYIIRNVDSRSPVKSSQWPPLINYQLPRNVFTFSIPIYSNCARLIEIDFAYACDLHKFKNRRRAPWAAPPGWQEEDARNYSSVTQQQREGYTYFSNN